MMLCNSLPSATLPPRLIPNTYKPPPGNAVDRILQLGRRETSRRGISVVTRAGPPSGNVYIFAFVFPLSLLAITIVTSLRIADKLDKKFMEELAVNQAILEEEGIGDEISVFSKEEPTPIRTRNRPKREVEPSSKQG